MPEEVLEKSGLRDNIVRYRFHENWYFTKDERNNYKNEQGEFIARVEVGREKRVFEPHYFQPGYTYTHVNKVLFYDHFRDSSGNVYAPKDVQYKINHEMIGKPNAPENVFNVSMIPWSTFEGFNLNLQKGYDYLIPIFTMGKYYIEDGQTILPLAIQVHHAVCDGFHICRFVNELQELINS